MIQKIDIRKIKENKDNPRYIRDNKFKKLVKSIKEFPEMLEFRPIIVDENMIVLGGNMRLKQEFIVKDNIGFGEWDWDILANEWDVVELNDWGLDLPEFEPNNIDVNEAIEVSDEGDKCPECGKLLK